MTVDSINFNFNFRKLHFKSNLRLFDNKQLKKLIIYIRRRNESVKERRTSNIDGHPSFLVTTSRHSHSTSLTLQFFTESTHVSLLKNSTRNWCLINYQTFAASQLGKCLTSRVSSTNFQPGGFLFDFSQYFLLPRGTNPSSRLAFESFAIYFHLEKFEGAEHEWNVCKCSQSRRHGNQHRDFSIIYAAKSFFREETFPTFYEKYRLQDTWWIFVNERGWGQ